MSHVLIVDDEPSVCWAFKEFLTDEGHEVSVAPSAEEALRLTEKIRPDAVVLDVRLPGLDGITAISRLRDRIGSVPIVVITAFGSLDTAVRAIAEGAFDYLPKPFDLDQAAEVVRQALGSVRPESALAIEKIPVAEESLIGSSPSMQQVFKQIALVAASDVPVLITGESGTGKELVARAIHRHSLRSKGPFLPICLAALNPGLVESELFGHVRGSFTGSTQDRKGMLDLAEGGTVLLDEIADTDTALQVKLLRAIEQREITPVGDPRPRATDIRILAATNRPLPELIAAGEFREDLYFRLSVFRILMPPLRERTEDIPALAEHFLRRIPQSGRELRISPQAYQELHARPWPGNVRELRNTIEHAAIMARGGEIRPEHLPLPQHPADAVKSSDAAIRTRIAEWAAQQAQNPGADPADVKLYERLLELAEPPLLRAVLEHCGQNRAAAAELLGLHRTTLRQKLRRHEIG